MCCSGTVSPLKSGSSSKIKTKLRGKPLPQKNGETFHQKLQKSVTVHGKERIGAS